MENLKNNKLTSVDSLTLARAIVSVLSEKKALDIRICNVADVNSFTDYYVIATGRSSTNVGSLADEVAYKIGLQGRDALRMEGKSGNAWILVDFGDVIVNIFDVESRIFYNFDRLMPEASDVDISDIVAEIDQRYDVSNKKHYNINNTNKVIKEEDNSDEL